jgi:hypothetical protein
MGKNTRIMVAAGLLGSCLIGTATYAAIDKEALALTVMHNAYETLPPEIQQQYIANRFIEMPYETKSLLVKNVVTAGELTSEDNAYVGTVALLQLNNPDRAAALEMVLDRSDYEVARHTTFYGLGKLTPEDSANALAGSGRNLWDHFTDRVREAYDDLFKR